MPTYEYSCMDCSHVYDKREGFDAPALQECPVCDGTARRVLHAASIVFKGSGFYVTDSRKPALSGGEGSTPAAESEAASDSSSDTSSNGTEPAAAS